MASDNFGTVVVLLNTQNPIELGPLTEIGVDSIMWIGALGQTGATAVGEALTGEINPSGALVDTYAYDSLSAPSAENLGSYSITNSELDRGDTYMVYSEGIYVGYRYYETRYEDSVMGTGGTGDFDYSSVVQFPFGHGLSYTEFEWSGFSVTETEGSEASDQEQPPGFQVSVTVTNTGDVAGKDIVQVYLQNPYTDYDRANRIEKSAVELVGYAKTDMLDPGQSQTLDVAVSREQLRTYDADGEGTYVLEAGVYYLTASTDAHGATNNVLAAKGFTSVDGMDSAGSTDMVSAITVDATDTSTYAVSQATGTRIINQFEDVDVRTYDESFTYLSRSDWEGTWPQTYQDGSWTAPQELLSDLEVDTTAAGDGAEVITEMVNSDYGELTAAMLIGRDYDDPAWNALIQQMSVSELDELVRVGGYATQAVYSVQLPGTVVKDGSAGISSTLVGGENGMAYPPEIVLASTWNDDLAERFGIAIGEDSLALEVAGWYAPSLNIHRSPYSGRNFEYFSEDATLSGDMAAAVIRGAQSKGVTAYMKHFALNDQETNRIGGAIFAHEQAVRQLYLAPFETAVREGGAMAVMASMNRVGATWSGGHSGLMTATLREEWGFEGVVVTDQASYEAFAYEDLREGLAAGTDLWLNTDADLWRLSEAQMTDAVVEDMQRAAHNIMYAVVNSNAMNGLTANAQIVQVTPTWKRVLYAVDGIVTLAIAGIIFYDVRSRRRRQAKAGVAAG